MVENDLGDLRRLALRAKPNPFNPVVELSFYVPESFSKDVKIKIFDMAGRLVKEYSGSAHNGNFKRRWNGKDNLGKAVGSGIYLVRALTANHKLTTRITMIK